MSPLLSIHVQYYKFLIAMERAGLTCRSRTDRVFDESDYRYDKIGLSLVIDPITGVQQLPFHDETLVIDIGKAQTATSRGQDVKVGGILSQWLFRDCCSNEKIGSIHHLLWSRVHVQSIRSPPTRFRAKSSSNLPFHSHTAMS